MRMKGMFLVFLGFLMLSSAVVYGKDGNEKYRLVFSTFDISSAGNYAYLRDGIKSMLASRFAAMDRVIVLDRTLSEKEFISLKNKQPLVSGNSEALAADYLVTGSLYGLKSGMNIQIVLYPFAADKEILHFEVLVKNPENIIVDVDKLSSEIAQSAFIYKTIEAETAKNSVDGGDTSGFVTVHPEAAYKKGVHSGTVVGATGSSIQVTAKDGKKSLTLSKEIRVFAVGDVDGDAMDEMVVLVGNTLELYKLGGEKIAKVATASLPSAIECHALNIADLDHDGRMKIYVSATDGLNISSLIVAYNKGKGFSIVIENIPWYLRPVLVPGKGWHLAGQKKGAAKTELVKPGVYLLEQKIGRAHV